MRSSHQIFCFYNFLFFNDWSFSVEKVEPWPIINVFELKLKLKNDWSVAIFHILLFSLSMLSDLIFFILLFWKNRFGQSWSFSFFYFFWLVLIVLLFSISIWIFVIFFIIFIFNIHLNCQDPFLLRGGQNDTSSKMPFNHLVESLITTSKIWFKYFNIWLITLSKTKIHNDDQNSKVN